jgi:3-oxoacyl-[acyl-carrier protein] reductase
MAMTRRHAVVSGGRGALGSVIAGTLREGGWSVDAPGRTELDVRDEQAVRAYFSSRNPNLLVCAAGAIFDAPLARVSVDDWHDVWSVNFIGAQSCARAVIPGMAARGGGHIVFISSHSAVSPPAGQAAYATAKAALLGLTEQLARFHGPDNIRVNAVLPGFLETKMTENVSGRRRAEVLAEHKLGRLNSCEAVARFIQHLHEQLPHTSGQVFQLDSR